jgi:hypothetical protein
VFEQFAFFDILMTEFNLGPMPLWHGAASPIFMPPPPFLTFIQQCNCLFFVSVCLYILSVYFLSLTLYFVGLIIYQAL